MELLVVIFMFVLPVVMAIRDSKKRSQAGKSEPVEPEAKFEYELSHEEFGAPLEQLFEQQKTAPRPPYEAPKAVHKEHSETKKEEPERERLSDRLTEAQKLVVYSEIMKPKFEK